ncbi:MAG TPA: hypothetical protein PKW94_00235 [Candidatus Dojkabacteria bacterium]|jgi:predicted nucleotidyltransferase|nr:hypothetical protein [Candidatus Dojkabacteria bacterium]HOR05816.1 hypothetical protein [Candidatus Dojkabacteria bacterium]HOT60724.1 hypothetical protein [Candidatus Dojkabacteria bacterium]HQI92395.1 hypothetical protein [Candidatus Dojkabacteria bacterium]
MEDIKKSVENLEKFRTLMGASLKKDDIKRIWGKSFLRESKEKYEQNVNEIVKGKLEYAENIVKVLKIFNWVKFIGVSGSVGAGFAKEEDDIDILVVVKDGTAWVYRGLISIANLFHNKIRAKRHKVIKNKLCLNMICEERGLKFDNDIFNFHELMFLVPIYNEKYLNFIYSNNLWLRESYFVKKDLLYTKISRGKNANFFIKFLNTVFYLLQISFMYISNHKPDLKRIKRNYKKGRIEFFEEDFKKEKLEDYLK